MAEGWIKLHRKIWEHEFFQEKRKFSKFEAWIDLILQANYFDNKFLLGNEVVLVARGSFVTSIRKLSKRWSWSNSKVKAFLSLLESQQMVVQKSDTKKTVLTIENYELYQSDETPKRHENDTKTTRSHTNKNIKKEKNLKNKDLINNSLPDTIPTTAKLFHDFVLLTEEEYQKLATKYGQAMVDEKIEELNAYGHTHPKEFRSYSKESHYYVLGNWLRREIKKQGEKGGYANERKPNSKIETSRDKSAWEEGEW
jgi:hypothetical protein